MISPQEPSNTPLDGADYSWSPFGPYNYWRKRIGADIAAAIENIDATTDAAHEVVIRAAAIARGEQMP